MNDAMVVEQPSLKATNNDEVQNANISSNNNFAKISATKKDAKKIRIENL